MTNPSQPGRPLFRLPNPEPGSLAASLAGAGPDTPPSLHDALVGMAAKMSDLQGQMLYGDQWPAVKEAQAKVSAHQRAEAVRQAKLDRLATLVRRVFMVYLLTALALMATAGAVWAWRVAL